MRCSPPPVYGQKYGQFNGPVHGAIKQSRYAPRHWGGRVKLKSLWLPSRSVFSPKIYRKSPFQCNWAAATIITTTTKADPKKNTQTKNHKTRKKLYPSTATTTTITADPTIIKNIENWVGNRESWWQWKYPVNSLFIHYLGIIFIYNINNIYNKLAERPYIW